MLPKPTIGLNLLYARPEIGGAFEYIKNILAAIASSQTPYRFRAYVQADCCSIVPSDPRFTVVGVRPFRAAATRCLYELFILPGRARRDGVSLLHYFGNVVGIGGPKSLVTVYDLIPFEHHAGRTFRTLYMRAMIPRSVRKARITLPMSNSTREQILTHVKTHGATLRVIPNPLASRFRRAPAGEVRPLRSAEICPTNTSYTSPTTILTRTTSGFWRHSRCSSVSRTQAPSSRCVDARTRAGPCYRRK